MAGATVRRDFAAVAAPLREILDALTAVGIERSRGWEWPEGRS